MSCVAHIKANDDEATSVVLDHSSVANHGVLKIGAGAVNTEDHTAPGHLVRCFDYEGIALSITVPSVVDYNFTSSLSVIVCFNCANAGLQALTGRYDGISKFQFLIYLQSDNGNAEIHFYVTLTGGVVHWCSANVGPWVDFLDKWHVVYLIFNRADSGNRLRGYFNNSEICGAVAGNSDLLVMNTDIFIGQTGRAALRAYFSGLIDLSSIYNHVLEPWERSYILNDGLGTEQIPGEDPTPELWYDTYSFNPNVPRYSRNWQKDDGSVVYRFSHRPTPMKIYVQMAGD